MSIGKIIGIGGGVGPAASNQLAILVTENTLNAGTDQGHLRVIHVNNPRVPDRTEYLKKLLRGESVKPDDNPALAMVFTARAIEAAAKIYNPSEIYFVVACNTFHAPPIWDQFTAELKKQGVMAKPVHLIDAAVGMLSEVLPQVKKIGVLSTDGTREFRIYRDRLENLGYEVLEVSKKRQSQVQDIIYNVVSGLKAKSPATDWAVEGCLESVDDLCKEGAEGIFLGCTELPLAMSPKHYEKRGSLYLRRSIPIIDPMVAGARALIRAVDEDKVIPLELDLAA